MTLHAHAASRVLVLAPRGRDADVVSQVLAAHRLRSVMCPTFDALVEELRTGADLALVTEESLTGHDLTPLTAWVESQPPWSDFPFIVFATRRVGRRPSTALAALHNLGNVVLLERPLNAETLVSATRAALRGRSRQYATRRHLAAVEVAVESERVANAEALVVKQALEIALEAGELGTFHCPFPLGGIEANAACKAHFWMDEDDRSDIDGFFARLHADDVAMARDALERTVANGDIYDIEHRTVSPVTGAVRWLRAKGRIYRDAAGEPVRFDGVTLDIDRQKRLEDERETRLAAERQARLEAERAGRMKDEFLATLSHELRTPLSAILGWTHLLSRPDAKTADVARAAATIERNARAQARLIEDLLDISRITSGHLTLELAPLRIDTLFDAVLQALKPAAETKQVSVAVVGDRPDVDLDGDAARIQQVVWNLVSNAIKFTPAGGRVTLRAGLDGDHVVLEVQDTGTGIPGHFLPHVFERFRQAESSSARSFGGLGLGLAIVRQLVELHGGTVAARSPGAGLGATFTVRLPIHANGGAPTLGPGAMPVAAGPGIGSDALAGLHLVVVEDEADGRDMLTRLLEQEGARVTALGSADDALALLQHTTPDLLISDIGMPRVDGHELMRRVRAHARPEVRELAAIAVTAFAHADDAARARAAGFQRHLPKPIEPDALLAAITDLHRKLPALLV